jgi:hypothetical protein
MQSLMKSIALSSASEAAHQTAKASENLSNVAEESKHVISDLSIQA